MAATCTTSAIVRLPTGRKTFIGTLSQRSELLLRPCSPLGNPYFVCLAPFCKNEVLWDLETKCQNGGIGISTSIFLIGPLKFTCSLVLLSVFYFVFSSLGPALRNGSKPKPTWQSSSRRLKTLFLGPHRLLSTSDYCMNVRPHTKTMNPVV